MNKMFQHAAARRRLVEPKQQINYYDMFQHAAARRRLETACVIPDDIYSVSTRSRPKAAGTMVMFPSLPNCCFNTQPPEGGWFLTM